MRVLVCGGRAFDDRDLVFRVLTSLHKKKPFSFVIHGAQRGVDNLAHRWALLNPPVMPMLFPADWERHGCFAGRIRNARMLRDGKPDLVIAFPGGPGTRNMVCLALDDGIPVIMVKPNGEMQRLNPQTTLAMLESKKETVE